MPRRALITGVGGQDGSYLAELPLDSGYEVSGVVRRAPSVDAENLARVRDRIELREVGLLAPHPLVDVLRSTRPHSLRRAQNHEPPRRPLDFVPRKVARAAASISLGQASELVPGDLAARRDWGMRPTTSMRCGRRSSRASGTTSSYGRA